MKSQFLPASPHKMKSQKEYACRKFHPQFSVLSPSGNTWQKSFCIFPAQNWTSNCRVSRCISSCFTVSFIHFSSPWLLAEMRHSSVGHSSHRQMLPVICPWSPLSHCHPALLEVGEWMPPKHGTVSVACLAYVPAAHVSPEMMQRNYIIGSFKINILSLILLVTTWRTMSWIGFAACMRTKRCLINLHQKPSWKETRW